MTVDKKLFSNELIDALLGEYKKPEDLIGENGLLKHLTKALVERALQAEMTEHLGHGKNQLVAIDDSFATFDQIVTAEAHRRKGLGRHVMTALSKASLELGATRGILVATEAGAALYKALGWSMVSSVTAASFSR